MAGCGTDNMAETKPKAPRYASAWWARRLEGRARERRCQICK